MDVAGIGSSIDSCSRANSGTIGRCDLGAVLGGKLNDYGIGGDEVDLVGCEAEGVGDC